VASWLLATAAVKEANRQTPVLHLAPLEETRTEKEKPDSIGS